MDLRLSLVLNHNESGITNAEGGNQPSLGGGSYTIGLKLECEDGGLVNVQN